LIARLIAGESGRVILFDSDNVPKNGICLFLVLHLPVGSVYRGKELIGKHYKIGVKLGSGAYAIVRAATSRSNKRPYAIKLISKVMFKYDQLSTKMTLVTSFVASKKLKVLGKSLQTKCTKDLVMHFTLKSIISFSF